MKQHQEALQSLRANIKIKENHSFEYLERIPNSEMCLEKPESVNLMETTYGKLNYLSNRRKNNFYLRIDSLNQTKELFLVRTNKYAIYQPTLNQVITGEIDLKDASHMFTLLAISKNELRRNYIIRKLNNVRLKNEEMWHLRISPKNFNSYKFIELWVDRHGMIRQIKVYERNGNWKSVLLSDLKKNKKGFDASIFKLKLPKGTKIID